MGNPDGSNWTPRVIITPEAKEKLDLYIDLCPDEISGFGEVVIDEDGDFIIHDLFILDQEVSGAHTEISAATIQKALMQMISEDKDPSTIKLWWHSHVYFEAFWSTVDDDACDLWINNKWMIAIVGNKRGVYRVRLDIYEPVRVTCDDIRLEILGQETEGLKDELKKEIAQKVRKLPKPQKQGYGGPGGYGELGWMGMPAVLDDEIDEIIASHEKQEVIPQGPGGPIAGKRWVQGGWDEVKMKFIPGHFEDLYEVEPQVETVQVESEVEEVWQGDMPVG